jgi:hypothetical protein
MDEPPFLIRIDSDASGLEMQHNGRYLAAYDPDGMAGFGLMRTTQDPERAIHFHSVEVALETWNKASRVRPFRDDGRPNKPLTAFTVEFLSLAEARAMASANPIKENK